jgi:hypothetical protein
MKMNEFICPSCGHRWFDKCAYGTCDACNTFFYLSPRNKPREAVTNEWRPVSVRYCPQWSSNGTGNSQ